METLKRENFATLEDYAAALEKQNAEAKAKIAKQQAQGVRMKVTEKGGMSFYGIGKYPATFYKSQWLKILANAAAIVEFLKEHDSELTTKDDLAA